MHSLPTYEAVAVSHPPRDTSQAANQNPADATALRDLVLSALVDAKAVDVTAIALDGTAVMFDHVVIASGTSDRHVNSVVAAVLRRVKGVQAGVTARLEGKPSSGWQLIDVGDVVVHVFLPEIRAFYDLERMWVARTEATRPTGDVNVDGHDTQYLPQSV